MEIEVSGACSCVIESLILNKFSMRTPEERKSVIAKGRPTPAMKLLVTERKTKGKANYIRHFNVKDYDKHKWLTGSEKLNKLFCWDCLLFNMDAESSIWIKGGYDNLNGLCNALVKHSLSQKHIRCFFKLSVFGSYEIDVLLNEQKKLEILQHNENVTKNREILHRLINAVCFLSKTESSFRGHDEGETSTNRGRYVEYLQYVSEFDTVLKKHLETSTVFKGTSNRIQNDLINSVSTVVLKQIKEEVKDTKFVAILLDETSDVMNVAQLSTVLRYVDKEGLAHERFVGYKDVSSDKTAAALFEHVVQVVEEFGIQEKLVAQSYDGAAVMAGHLTGLCTRVQAKYPSALFVHCFAHRLNLVLQKVCTNIKECRLFFSLLSALPTFFSNSPKRKNALNVFMTRTLPRVAPTRWNFTSRLVNVIFEFLPQLSQFFQHLLDNPEDWDEETILKANGYAKFLSEFANIFLLVIFAKLFAYTDTLYNILQTTHFDIGFCFQKVLSTKALVDSERDNFDDIWEDAQRKWADCRSVTHPAKRTRRQDPRDSQRRLFIEIIDHIATHISDRYKSMENFKFIELLNPEKFDAHHRQFPEAAFKALAETYPDHFDTIRLKNELSVLYGGGLDELQDKSPHQLVKSMRLHNLNQGITELYKLACLYLTIPSTTASVERSFSALKRIHTLNRATQGQDRLASLALLSIEQSVLCTLRLDLPSFYASVIGEFVQQERRMEFIFK
jgi:hypothetical protein